jgi:hypothetical protein
MHEREQHGVSVGYKRNWCVAAHELGLSRNMPVGHESFRRLRASHFLTSDPDFKFLFIER